jgi:hypothetical protein
MTPGSEKTLSFSFCASSTRHVEEMGILQGASIVDIAVITPRSMEGFEIKSASDSLRRLPAQTIYYNLVFDFVSIITEESHLKHTMEMIPDFWGVIIAHPDNVTGSVTFQSIKEPEQNIATDPEKIAQLLWRNEVKSILQGVNQLGLSRLTRLELWNILARTVSKEDLRTVVYNTLKGRKAWK